MIDEAKACPICGSKDTLGITQEDSFNRCLQRSKEESGVESAAISIRCWKCSLELWEHDYGGTDYHVRHKHLIDRWNAMPRREDVDDGK